MSRVILALAAIGLVVAVWLSWPDPSADETEPTIPAAASTSSTRALATTSTGPGTTTTGVTTSHVVATVEEAEAILRELWFGWFEGIYNQDEERIREVVILDETVATAKQSFDVEFARAPRPEDLSFAKTEILRSDEYCLAIWTELGLSGFRNGASEGVEVLRWTGSQWKSLATWGSRKDLWEADCESLLP